MTGEPRFLGSLEQVDEIWMEQVLSCAGFSDIAISRVSLKPIGAGNVSDTVRVAIDHDRSSSGPASVICKFSAADPVAHAHGIASGSYGREVASYRTFSDAGQVCRIPLLYWVSGDSQGINLVMEDLTGSTRAGDQISGCNVDEANVVIDELARLHSRFYPIRAEERPDWALAMAEVADYWENAITRAIPIIADNDRGRITAKEWDELHLAARKARTWYELPVERATLTHGDPRVDNILFEDRNGGVSAVIIDWQMTGWRNPMHDIGYFLSGSVSVDDRRSQELAMLERYVRTFGEDKGYDLGKVRDDYRIQLLSGLMTTVGAYSVLPMSEAIDLLLITLLKRNLAAAADWNSLDAF